MEPVILEDSPLAAYIEGKGDSATHSQSNSEDSPAFVHFAPHGSPRARLGPSRSLFQSVLQARLASQTRQACAALVNSTLGSVDNDRFLEHFRYIIIASQLLNDHVGPTSSEAPYSLESSSITLFPSIAATSGGALTVAIASFTSAWLLHWVRGGGEPTLHLDRIFISLILGAILALTLYAYATRQWLQRLRHEAIQATSKFVLCIQGLERASTSVLSMIQEVEVISRGYRITGPLPPVSRLESDKPGRKCVRLRRHLRSCYAAIIPALLQSISRIRNILHDESLDRFLDIYNISNEDLNDAAVGYVEPADEEELESLQFLRLNQARYATLRRLLMCCLLSLDATGQNTDAARWSTAITGMDDVALVAAYQGDNLTNVLHDEDSTSSPTSPRHRGQTVGHEANPLQSRLHNQLHRMSTLSGGIRTLQAKVYLLREDSKRALANPSSERELSSVSAPLRDQYDSLGADLQALMHAWEEGKKALSQDITRQARRLSRSSSLLSEAGGRRAAACSGLETVGEDDSRKQTLAALNGSTTMPISPPATDDGSDENSNNGEVFEAISSPKVRERSDMNRNQRIAKMKEQREQQEVGRQSRREDVEMMKELQSVIKLRPFPRHEHNGRVTSI